VAKGILSAAVDVLNSLPVAKSGKFDVNGNPSTFERSFMELAACDSLAAQRFHHALAKFITDSAVLYSIIPPFEFAVYQPLTVLGTSDLLMRDGCSPYLFVLLQPTQSSLQAFSASSAAGLMLRRTTLPKRLISIPS
jgi:hypothetical protein